MHKLKKIIFKTHVFEYIVTEILYCILYVLYYNTCHMNQHSKIWFLKDIWNLNAKNKFRFLIILLRPINHFFISITRNPRDFHEPYVHTCVSLIAYSSEGKKKGWSYI